jgi:hypothetical protein
MPRSTFVFLDTNILFRYVTQGQSGCEPEHWLRLNELIEGSTVRPLIPEVVVLEFEKLTSVLHQSYAVNFGKLDKHLLSPPLKPQGSEKIWNEVGDFDSLLQSFRDQFEEWKHSKSEGSKTRIKEIEDWFRSAHVVTLPFDADILFRAKRRMLAGRLVDQEKRPEADCYIIESLAKFFEGRGEEDQLLFCTENSQDFAVMVNDKLSLHTVMKPGLPPTEVFSNLASLVSFLNENKAVEEPAPEKVKEAVEREKAKEIERVIELEEAVLEATTPNQSLPLGSQEMADAIKAFGLAGMSSQVRAVHEAMKSYQSVISDVSQFRAAYEATKLFQPVIPDLSSQVRAYEATK